MNHKPVFSPSKRKMKALGINIYGGGFTLGVLPHFEVVGQLEEIDLGKRTFDMNFHGIHRPLSIDDWNISQYHRKIDLVYANPPCAPWSSANTHAGKTIASRFEDWRLTLTEHTMKAAMEIEPAVFISESVENAFNIGVSHYDPYVEAWMKRGYSVTMFLTDAILHGSPSARRRFHFIAHKHELQLGKMPLPERPMTVRDAIGDLVHDSTIGQVPLHEFPSTSPDYTHLLAHVPPGGMLAVVLNNLPGYTGARASFLVKRLIWDAPAFTMVGFSFIHPDGKRFITFREAMRLCTYPDNFMAHNPTEAVDTVLPIIGDYLAKVAKRTIAAAKPRKPQFEVIDWRPYGLKWHVRHMKGGNSKYDLTKVIKSGDYKGAKRKCKM